MKPIGIAVIGLGHLGTYHAQKVAQNARAHLIALIEPDLERREKAANHHSVPAFSTLEELLAAKKVAAQVQALICASPTRTHYTIATRALEHGWHLLVEKPITHTLEEADALVALQKKTGLILQVGHCERFNPAVATALPLATGARFMTSERLGPFSGRSADIDVVLDLMIHDIDLCLTLLGDKISEIRAIGVPILTEACDMASIRMAFANGSVAQLSAGRASLVPTRKLRFFTPTRYLSVDCQAQEIHSIVRHRAHDNSIKLIPEDVPLVQGDTLSRQLDGFLDALARGGLSPVNAEMGRACLGVAERIKEAIDAQDRLFRGEMV